MPSVFSSNWIVLVLLWIKNMFSRMTESQPQRLAVDRTLICIPEIPSGSQQQPIVESQHLATDTRDTLVKNVAFNLITKGNDEKCQLILENQELGSLVTELKNEIDNSHLKHTELQNKHDEFVLLYQHEKKRHEQDMITARSEEMTEKGRIREEISAKVVELKSARSQLETQNQVIVDMKEKQLRLMSDDSSLRKNLEEKDRLLASKQSVLENLQLQFENRAKLIHHLLDKVLELDCKREGPQHVSQQIDRKMTADVGCGCNESMQLLEPISIEQPLVQEKLPAEDSISEPQIESKFTLPEAEVNSTDLTPILLEEISIKKPEAVEHFQSPEAPVDESMQLPEPKSIEDPLVPEVIPTEVSLPGPQIESKFTLPEAEVNSTDLTLILLDELNASKPTVVEHSQTPEAPPITQQEFIVRSDVTTQSFANYMIVKGITTENIGRVIGRQGSNMKRLERGYGVKLSFIKGILHITDGDCERRRAVCKNIIDNLPVVIECPLLPLGDYNIMNNQLLRQMSFKYGVQVYRPSNKDKNGIIWGTIDRCRTVYHFLKNASK